MARNNKINIFSLWLNWHFVEMPKFLISVWKNYLMFATNYFSVTLLLKTFFSPWRRYNWIYPKGFNIVEFFNTLVSNIFSRILGAMMRTALIIVGIIFQLFVIIVGGIIFLGWILMPFLIVLGLIFTLIY